MKALSRVVAKYGPLSHRELATGFWVACKLKLPFTFYTVGTISKERYTVVYKNCIKFKLYCP